MHLWDFCIGIWIMLVTWFCIECQSLELLILTVSSQHGFTNKLSPQKTFLIISTLRFPDIWSCCWKLLCMPVLSSGFVVCFVVFSFICTYLVFRDSLDSPSEESSQKSSLIPSLPRFPILSRPSLPKGWAEKTSFFLKCGSPYIFIIMPSLDLCLDTGGRVQVQHRIGKKELKVFGPYILEAIQQFMKIYYC